MHSLFFWTGILVWVCWILGALGLLALHLYGRVLVRRVIRRSLTEADAADRRRRAQNQRGGFIPWLIPTTAGVATGFHIEAHSDTEVAERLAEAIR